MNLRAKMERVRRAVPRLALAMLSDEELDRRIATLEAELRASGWTPGPEDLALDAALRAAEGR